jgi:hypothetical protein
MSTKTKASVKRLSSLGVALLLGASGSSAMAYVTQWNFDTSAFFITSDTVFGSGTGSQVNTAAELSWGATGGSFALGGDRSALTIGNPEFVHSSGDTINESLTGGVTVSGTVNTVTDGTLGPTDYGLGVNITHWNNPISGSFATLTAGLIRDTLTLTPVLPNSLPSQPAPSIDFDFRFAETENVTSGSCLDGTPAGATPCPDLFGIAQPLDTTLDIPFVYDGQTYRLSVLVVDESTNASPFEVLSDAECGEFTPSFGPGCGGFRTAEGAATTVQFAFAISTTPLFVPAPGPLSLFGLGLLGLGVARRAARKSS